MADKTEAPTTTLFNWDVEMHPRNLPPTSDRAIHVEVQATSKQEAINKAISQKPGHTWGEVRQLEAEPPHILVQEGKPVKAAHEASTIHERADMKPHPILEAFRGEAAAAEQSAAERYLARKLEQMAEAQPAIPEAFLRAQEPGLWAESWAKSWEPTRREGEELSIAQIVQEAIGSASMCWRQTPQGIFDSERASWVAGGAIDAIERVVFWQTGFHPGGKSMTMEEAEQKVALQKAKEAAKAEAEAHESDVLTNGAPLETGMAEEPEECRQARIRRDADKAAVIELILSYRNHADEETRMRQIRVVMD